RSSARSARARRGVRAPPRRLVAHGARAVEDVAPPRLPRRARSPAIARGRAPRAALAAPAARGAGRRVGALGGARALALRELRRRAVERVHRVLRRTLAAPAGLAGVALGVRAPEPRARPARDRPGRPARHRGARGARAARAGLVSLSGVAVRAAVRAGVERRRPR